MTKYVLCCPDCGCNAEIAYASAPLVPLLAALAEARYVHLDPWGYLEWKLCPDCLAAAAQGDSAPASDGQEWQDSMLDALAR